MSDFPDPAGQDPRSQRPPTEPFDHGAPTGPMNRPQYPGPQPGQGYQGPAADQGSGYQNPGYQDPPNQGRRRGHGLRNTIIVVIALLVVLIGLDRLAVFYVQGRIASEIQKQGFPAKPDVSIKGFPFLTQVVSRSFHDVQISSSKIHEGPIEIKKIDADLSNVKMNSGFSSGTVGHLTGAGVITFSGLSNALGSLVGGPLGDLVGNAGLTLKPAGRHEVKASVDLLGTSGSAVWRITRVSGTEIKVHLARSSGLPSGLLSSVRNIQVPIPKLPLGMKIQSVIVTASGLSIRVIGSNVAFGS